MIETERGFKFFDVVKSIDISPYARSGYKRENSNTRIEIKIYKLPSWVFCALFHDFPPSLHELSKATQMNLGFSVTIFQIIIPAHLPTTHIISQQSSQRYMCSLRLTIMDSQDVFAHPITPDQNN